jgi:hypothetical protein
VDRTELLAQAIKDVANPESAILQGPNNKECAGTAVMYVMAKQSPASYVRANVRLAEDGEVRIGSPYFRRPSMLRLNPWEPLNFTADRPITQQLAGEAFMQRAAGPSSSPRDTFFDGLTGDKVAETFSALFGRTAEAMYLPDAKEEPNARLRSEARKEARSVLEAEAQAGTLPMANYNGHWCVVSEADPRQANVTVVDGEGNKVDIPWEQFLDGLDTLVYDRNIYQTSDYVKAHPEWGRPGSGGGVINQTNGSSDAR